MKPKIIFIQSASHLGYALYLYEQLYNDKTVFVVFGIKSTYDYLLKLKLDIDRICFIPRNKNKYKYIVPIFKERLHLEKYYTKMFYNIKNSDIYFFSIYFDYATFFFLNKLKKNNKIFFCDIEKVKVNMPLRRFFKKTIYFFITGMIFDFTERYKESILTLSNEFRKKYVQSYFKKIDIDISFIYKKYKILIELPRDSIVIYDDQEDLADEFINYKEIMNNVIKLLYENKFKIFIKYHPRLGCSQYFTNNKYAEIIETEIQSEFIEFKNAVFHIGINSTAIANVAKLKKAKSLSLLNLFGYRNESYRKHFEEYLRAHSNNRINFVTDISSFTEILLNNRRKF